MTEIDLKEGGNMEALFARLHAAGFNEAKLRVLEILGSVDFSAPNSVSEERNAASTSWERSLKRGCLK